MTAVELLPVQAFFDERLLVRRGLRNYWGYNPIGYFAPDARYASTADAVREFKTMVRTLHASGIQVLLDVVYSHTAEGSEVGPTLSFRGIDDASYYRLEPNHLRRCQDVTGCGNSLNVRHPRVLRLLMNSLRYWVEEMHVDGFRFDLAPTLARGTHGFDANSAFFQALQQDPVLSRVQLIAEPWDLGAGGYQLGHFPAGWAEWNDKYRDTMRGWWRSEGGRTGEFAQRLTGSSDLFHHSGRRPTASINFIASHDGYTLADLVSYEEKHNEANGEHNRDGHSHNLSWNCGVEGPSDDPTVGSLRARQQRNLIATLLLSQGVPMLLAGDEMGRTQGGNNNAYCQNNETSWLDWTPTDAQRLIALRAAHPVLRRRSFLHGRLSEGDLVAQDIVWLHPDGSGMSDARWHAKDAVALGALLCGDALHETDPHGRPLRDDSFLLLLNPSPKRSLFDYRPSGCRLADNGCSTRRGPTRTATAQPHSIRPPRPNWQVFRLL